MTGPIHPAESAEFLSLLHDAELPPAEAAAFEAHRSACDACRDAVAEFERSLAAFRTAPTAQAPPDLSARILRKIRSQSPSRRPFGVMFGIDIRWAGLFMAALLVAIIAPALFFKREPPAATRETDAIPAYVVDAQSRDLPPVAPAVAEQPARRDRAKVPASKPREAGHAAESRSDAPALLPAAPAPAKASDEVAPESRGEMQLKSAARAAAAPRREVSVADRSGGEAGEGAAEEPGVAKVRLEVLALDGSGEAPPIVKAPPDDRLVALRGREFVLTVEAGGSVGAVASGGGPALAQKDSAVANQNASAPADYLRELRFQPGSRPRRLLIRIR